MLILTATNVTKVKGKSTLVRKNGTADYEVWVGINQHCIWKGEVNGHDRGNGASVLLRLIANKLEEDYVNCVYRRRVPRV